MIYWLQATVYGLAFFAIYLLLLRNKASFRWNRYYLMANAAMPLMLPFIIIRGVGGTLPAKAAKLSILLQEVTIGAGNSPGWSLSVWHIAQWCYAGIALWLVIRLLMQYLAILRLAKTTNDSDRLAEGAILLKHTGLGPGSFGRYIFIPGDRTDPAILEHELAHIRFGHSRDIFFTRLLQAIFWIFPVVHLIAAELKMTHEFEADSVAAGDSENYGGLLLGEIFGVGHIQIAHSFFHHPIKRRLAMLQQQQKSRRPPRTAIIRSGMATLTLAAGIIYLQSCSRPDEPASSSNRTEVVPTESKPDVYSYVEQMPESMVDIPTYLAKNIQYPQVAKDRGIEGRVIVRFVVNKEGNITNPTVVRSPDASLSDEAVRAVMSMPKWKPGKNEGKAVSVYMTLPIAFKLQ